uniref:Actin-interacting protein 1 n=1 Tax=Romanomermis culicivorax TaxID=13658 RepID=A0A915IGT6_ROMCU
MEPVNYELKSTFATLPRTTRGLPFVLGCDPKGKNFLYCCGNSVIIRNIEHPEICDIYTEHSTLTTVAKYAPSGFYIASGDQNGKIRIWDTTQKEHILKKEYQFISGAIRDIAWSNDNQRLAVVGEGRERFGHVFLFDTGTSNGNLSGQSKPMNSVDFRPARPFRLISASEDYTIAIFEGPPFKFKTLFQRHSRFAHCVRYNNDGSLFASCGADGKVFLYDGVEGSEHGEFIDPNCKGAAHSGGVYSLAWSPDGTKLLTSSGDKTCKLWDVSSRSLLKTFYFGKEVEDQQLACLWQGEYILSVSLSGFVYYLDLDNADRPKKILKGHNKPITCLTTDTDGQFIYTADMEGFITRWTASNGHSARLGPKFHKAQIQSMVFHRGELITTSIDDTMASVRGLDKGISEADDSIVKVEANSFKLPSQPRGVAVGADGYVAVVCQRELLIRLNGRQVAACQALDVLTCVSIHPKDKIVAAGGEDSVLRVYDFSDNSLKLIKELQQSGPISDVKYSPDGIHLATCDTSRRVVPYKLPSYELASKKEWTFHTARVNCLAWNPNSRHLATGSLDTSVIVWDLQNPGEYPIIIKDARLELCERILLMFADLMT